MERSELKQLVGALGSAHARGDFVFLSDPAWGASERSQAEQTMKLAETGQVDGSFGWLCIPTGGSSGQLRFARHDEGTLSAAVQGFCQHFGVARVAAVGVLPPWHVSGLMAQVRCHVSGGPYIAWTWKQLGAGEFPMLPNDEAWTLSLVPTQLQRLLGFARAADWLRHFRMIFLGGGPIWPELLEKAHAAHLPISTCYGTTETAAMIAALRPEEFTSGIQSAGKVMPHAQVTIVDETVGECRLPGQAGLIRIQAGSLYRGYFPDTKIESTFVPEDLGSIDEKGYLQLLGRRDAVIITGGEKVNPSEVEKVLRATGQFEDIAVVGLPDEKWGSMVVAGYPAAQGTRDWDKLRSDLASNLAGYKIPKRFIAVDSWPRNEQGKINRAELQRLLSEQSVGQDVRIST